MYGLVSILLKLEHIEIESRALKLSPGNFNINLVLCCLEFSHIRTMSELNE
jgi:hypothetical protein